MVEIEDPRENNQPKNTLSILPIESLCHTSNKALLSTGFSSKSFWHERTKNPNVSK